MVVLWLDVTFFKLWKGLHVTCSCWWVFNWRMEARAFEVYKQEEFGCRHSIMGLQVSECAQWYCVFPSVCTHLRIWSASSVIRTYVSSIKTLLFFLIVQPFRDDSCSEVVCTYVVWAYMFAWPQYTGLLCFVHSKESALSCSEDGTTAWCGISILPLAFIISMDVAKERKELRTSGYGEHLIVVSRQYKERIQVEVEPQVGWSKCPPGLCATQGALWQVNVRLLFTSLFPTYTYVPV